MDNATPQRSGPREGFLDHPDRGATWLLGMFGVLGVIAVVVGALCAQLTQDEWLDDFWFEVSKAGLQVVAVGVFGGALAAVWRAITARRDRESAMKDKIRDELVSLVELYNRVKSVRRTLRSLGLDVGTYPELQREEVRTNSVLSKEQADGFHAQMVILNGLQLGFESKVRQFGQTDFLGLDTNHVVKLLGTIEEHLNEVLDLWEQRGWTIREGTRLEIVSDGLQKLFRVRQYLWPNVSDPLREITRLINKHLFGEATKTTSSALDLIFATEDERPSTTPASA